MIIAKFFGLIFSLIGGIIKLIFFLIEPAIVIITLLCFITGILLLIKGKSISERISGIPILIFAILMGLVIFN